MHPTHQLKIYHHNSKKANLLRIEQDKLPKELENPRQRGMTFSCYDEKTISNIKVESARE